MIKLTFENANAMQAELQAMGWTPTRSTLGEAVFAVRDAPELTPTGYTVFRVQEVLAPAISALIDRFQRDGFVEAPAHPSATVFYANADETAALEAMRLVECLWSDNVIELALAAAKYEKASPVALRVSNTFAHGGQFYTGLEVKHADTPEPAAELVEDLAAEPPVIRGGMESVCVNHHDEDRPAVTNLDGDDLCRECADEWVRGEGAAAMDADDRAGQVGEPHPGPLSDDEIDDRVQF